MANKRLPLNKQLQVLYNTPEELRGLNDLCIKMTGKTLGYGGIVYIQDPGEKKKDSIYLDKFKPGLYYCKANSTTTSNDTSIFIDYSNYTIGNKLENYSIIPSQNLKFKMANIEYSKNLFTSDIFQYGKIIAGSIIFKINNAPLNFFNDEKMELSIDIPSNIIKNNWGIGIAICEIWLFDGADGIIIPFNVYKDNTKILIVNNDRGVYTPPSTYIKNYDSFNFKFIFF